MTPAPDATVDWPSGTWLNPPLRTSTDAGHLLVTAVEASDFWRTTAYGFVHDDGHGLLRPLESGRAIEVTFRLDYGRQFDQAGVLVRADEHHWLKAGVEVVDGAPQLGAVVTHDASDWSAQPVPAWQGDEVHYPGEPCCRCTHRSCAARRWRLAVRAPGAVATGACGAGRTVLLCAVTRGPAGALHGLASGSRRHPASRLAGPHHRVATAARRCCRSRRRRAKPAPAGRASLHSSCRTDYSPGWRYRKAYAAAAPAASWATR